jgi:hypothetical protein
MSGLPVPGTDQQGQGVGDGQQDGGHGADTDLTLLPVTSHDSDLGALGRPGQLDLRKRTVVRVPEGDSPVPRQ